MASHSPTTTPDPRREAIARIIDPGPEVGFGAARRRAEALAKAEAILALLAGDEGGRPSSPAHGVLAEIAAERDARIKVLEKERDEVFECLASLTGRAVAALWEHDIGGPAQDVVWARRLIAARALSVSEEAGHG